MQRSPRLAAQPASTRPARGLRGAWPRRMHATGLAVLLLAGCASPRSTLAPAGEAADSIATLFWVMTAGAAIVWIAVMVIAFLAIRARPGEHDPRSGRRLIIIGGAIVPTVVLAALLVYGLSLMPKLRAPATAGAVPVLVSGEQWWWRVRYLPEGGEAVELANEIRIPVGQRTEFRLVSPDVIHSFWVPSLAGKMDMIPGRMTTLVVEPTETGVFRGVCAEFCGTSHAFMEFAVVVQEPEDFQAWLRHQATPASPPTTPATRRGWAAFMRNGCGGCHQVRGTPAQGLMGPDLTHVGSRLTLAAGVLPNTAPAFRRWIAHTHAVKPDALMPEFDMLPPDELEAIALYLESLK